MTKEQLEVRVKELEESNSSLATENTELKAQVEEQKAFIEELNSEVNRLAGNGSAPSPQTIEHKGKTYRLASPRFRLDSRTLTLQDLEADPTLVKQVLSIDGQQILIPNS